MEMLNENQIEQILRDFQARDLKDPSLQDEVLDHLACLIEEAMQEGSNFSDAYAKAQKEFPSESYTQLAEQCVEAKEKAQRKHNFPWFALSSVASILFFIFFIGDGNAQSYPGIQPIPQDTQVALPEIGVSDSDGVLFRVRGNSPVHATARGIVLEIQNLGPDIGCTLLIQHSNHIQTQYIGLNQILVSKGENVEQGQCLGKVLSPRNNIGYLRYRVTWEGQAMDPRNFYSENTWAD